MASLFQIMHNVGSPISVCYLAHLHVLSVHSLICPLIPAVRTSTRLPVLRYPRAYMEVDKDLATKKSSLAKYGGTTCVSVMIVGDK